MNRIARPQFVVFLAPVVASAALVCGPRQAALPEAAETWWRANSIPPDPAFRRIADNVDRRDAVVANVRSGRLSLVAAAGEFRHLYPDESMVGLYFAGATIDERYCRMVIHHVASHDADDRTGLRVAPELEAELAHRLACGMPLTAGHP